MQRHRKSRIYKILSKNKIGKEKNFLESNKISLEKLLKKEIKLTKVVNIYHHTQLQK